MLLAIPIIPAQKFKNLIGRGGLRKLVKPTSDDFLRITPMLPGLLF